MLQKEQESINNTLLRYYNKRVFTAAALGAAKLSGEAFNTIRFYCGKTSDKYGAKEVSESTFFDVASLTKALVTIPCLLALLKEGKLHLHQSLPELLACSVPADKQSITLDQLVRHTSGLPSHRQYFKEYVRHGFAVPPLDIVELILSEELISKPGEKYCYSDLDYMLLGRIIEKKSEESLYRYWKRTIIEPLGMADHYHFADSSPGAEVKTFAETGRCLWSGAVLRGLVHDDNCRAMGKTAGHAGLFSTLDGILFLCNNILLNYIGMVSHPSFNTEDLHYFATRSGKERRAPGFDVPRKVGSSAGSHFSFQSIGHLGYTGTSFWVDLKKRISVVLLTNRVYYGDDSEGIRQMRADVHDRVMQSLQNV